jgi:hypothetical protein
LKWPCVRDDRPSENITDEHAAFRADEAFHARLAALAGTGQHLEEPPGLQQSLA